MSGFRRPNSKFNFVKTALPKSSVSQSPAFSNAGSLAVIRSVSGNLATAPFDSTISVPSGHVFYPYSCGLVLVYADAIVALGSLRFGIPSDRDLYVPATSSLLTAAPRMEEYLVRDEVNRNTGVTSVSGGLASSGILTQAIGYFFFRGFMVKK